MNILIRIGKSIDTERGAVFLEGVYTREEAKDNGFVFSFHSSMIDCDLYLKSADSSGIIKRYAVVKD